MSAKLGKRNLGATATDGVTVFGQVEPTCVDLIDRVAEQMLMPRSWVVSQILKEWVEKRTGMEARPVGGLSWDDSFREIISRYGEETLVERQQRVSA
jgi:hypothetical protein